MGTAFCQTLPSASPPSISCRLAHYPAARDFARPYGFPQVLRIHVVLLLLRRLEPPVAVIDATNMGVQTPLLLASECFSAELALVDFQACLHPHALQQGIFPHREVTIALKIELEECK